MPSIYNVPVHFIFLIAAIAGLLMLLSAPSSRKKGTLFLGLLLLPVLAHMVALQFVKTVGHQRNFFYLLPVYLIGICVIISRCGSFVKIIIVLILASVQFVQAALHFETIKRRVAIREAFHSIVPLTHVCTGIVAGGGDADVFHVYLRSNMNIPYSAQAFRSDHFSLPETLNWFRRWGVACAGQIIIYDFNEQLTLPALGAQSCVIKHEGFVIQSPYLLRRVECNLT